MIPLFLHCLSTSAVSVSFSLQHNPMLLIPTLALRFACCASHSGFPSYSVPSCTWYMQPSHPSSLQHSSLFLRGCLCPALVLLAPRHRPKGLASTPYLSLHGFQATPSLVDPCPLFPHVSFLLRGPCTVAVYAPSSPRARSRFDRIKKHGCFLPCGSATQAVRHGTIVSKKASACTCLPSPIFDFT